MIRLVVVEDETLFRLGLQTLLNLNRELTVVGEAGDGEEALRMVEALKPDVVIMEVNRPKLSGIGALERLRKAGV